MSELSSTSLGLPHCVWAASHLLSASFDPLSSHSLSPPCVCSIWMCDAGRVHLILVKFQTSLDLFRQEEKTLCVEPWCGLKTVGERWRVILMKSQETTVGGIPRWMLIAVRWTRRTPTCDILQVRPKQS